MEADAGSKRPEGATLEYAAAPPHGAGGGAWSVVGLGLSLAGFGYVAWIAAQLWWYLRKGYPVTVFLNWEWFVLPALGAGVSLVGLWRARRRGTAACGLTLAVVSVVMLLLMAGRWR
jgi:hypothetical protein